MTEQLDGVEQFEIQTFETFSFWVIAKKISF